MSSFTTPLEVEILREQRKGRTLARVIKEFEYYDDEILPVRYTVKVNKGFITDFASIPRFLWVLLPPLGRYAKAAVVHDYLVSNRKLDYKTSAKIFYNAMLVLGVNQTKAFLMYKAVVWFGPKW